MLHKTSRWLKNLWSRGLPSPPLPPVPELEVNPLSDSDYEQLFMELLDGVNQEWHWGQVRAFLIAKGIHEADLVEWLRRFGERVLNSASRSSVPNQELGQQMVEFGKLGHGELAEVAQEIGRQLLIARGEQDFYFTSLNQSSVEQVSQRMSEKSILLNFIVEDPPKSPNTFQTSSHLPEAEAADITYSTEAASAINQERESLSTIEQKPPQETAPAIEVLNSEAEALFNQGLEQAQAGNLLGAVDSWGKVIQLQPNYHLAYNNRGLALYELGRYSEALADYNHAIQLQPNYLAAYNNRGTALYELGRYSEALADFNQAIKLQSNYHLAYYNRGNALNKLGRYSDAFADYNQAIQLQPNYPNAYNNRGNVLNKLGRYREALADYSQTIKLQPNHPGAYYNRGNALSDLGRYREALTDYSQTIKLQPNDPDAYIGRGNALNKLGRYAGAITDYNQAIHIKPDSWEAWANLGWLIFYTEGYQAALRIWDEGLAHLNPTASDYQLGCGSLHYHKGKTSYEQARQQSQYCLVPDEIKTLFFDAINSYQQALEIFQDNPRLREPSLEVLQDLAIIYRHLCDLEQAKKSWETAIVLLEQLIEDTDDPLNKIRLARKFAGLYQLQVDRHAQSPQLEEQIQALELAEEHKNLCLNWLRENRLHKSLPESPKYDQMQQLLNPDTAALYWHISPAAITTFILKYNQPPLVRVLKAETAPSPSNSLTLDESNTAADQQLQRFETWLNVWKADYEKNRKDAKTKIGGGEWQTQMSSRLEELGLILNIPQILPHLTDITHLILIPHRDLHLLPLHYLFHEQNFSITYLPSLQVGLDLEQHPVWAEHPQQMRLLSVENPGSALLYAEIESAAISQLFPNCHPISSTTATKNQVISALLTESGIFHFTGHGNHNTNHPAESYLQLANEEQLTLREIFDLGQAQELPLRNYHLVCLCACETGVTGRQGLINEFVGLASGFLAQGVTYVISTLWTIDERSTALLIVELYHLLKRGKTPPEALKQAQNWLRHITYKNIAQWYRDLASELETCAQQRTNDALIKKIKNCIAYLKTEAQIIEDNPDMLQSPKLPYDHPYYWASFILTGKPNLNRP